MMKKQVITSRIQIGAATILFLFIIICLAVFSLLSISNAHSSLTFSKQHSDFVTKYYKADAMAQQWIRDLNHFIKEGDSLSKAMTKAIHHSESPASIGIKFHNKTIQAIFSLENGQEIQITFRKFDQKIIDYTLHNSKQYNIDQSLPVFVGEPEE